MSEENRKEEKPKPAEEKPKEETAKPETPPKPETAKPEKEPKKAPQKVEKPKECVVCGKNMDKRWYYREGKYYCGKGCWKKAKKEAREAAAKKEADSAPQKPEQST